MHRISYLPIYLPHSGLNIRDWHVPQRRPSADAITVFVLLLCLCILWWLSHPVNVEMKDGRIVAIHQIEDMPLSLNDTHVELAVLASAASPIASLFLNDTHVELTVLASATSPIASSPQNFTRNNETEAHLVRKTD